MNDLKLKIYYKTTNAEKISIYTKKDVYAEFIRCYHYLKSIKADFKLEITSDTEHLVRVNYTNNIKMYCINRTSIPYHTQHYLKEYM